MEKEMDKEKKMIMMDDYYLKVNILMKINGMVKDMIKIIR